MTIVPHDGVGNKKEPATAVGARTDFGRQLIAGQWAGAEFDVLGRFWAAGVPVPYPVSLDGSELLMEFAGDSDGNAAPRLAQLRPEPDLLASLWEQCVDAMTLMARLGYTHGDLSAYNVLVNGDRLIVIDLPQTVDIVGNPQGRHFLRRDVVNICEWFSTRGIADADPDRLTTDLMIDAGMRT